MTSGVTGSKDRYNPKNKRSPRKPSFGTYRPSIYAADMLETPENKRLRLNFLAGR